jgi:hypothetical protein
VELVTDQSKRRPTVLVAQNGENLGQPAFIQGVAPGVYDVWADTDFRFDEGSDLSTTSPLYVRDRRHRLIVRSRTVTAACAYGQGGTLWMAPAVQPECA